MFNMITGINESKKLMSCQCKFHGRKYNSGEWLSNEKCPCEYKKSHLCEKYYIGSLATCSCENCIIDSC